MKEDRVYLLHIKDAIQRIVDYTSHGQEAFLSDSKTQDAVIRNLEIIGEAVKSLSEDLKQSHPNVPWKQVAGMRDKMIHEYFGVNLNLVWKVIEENIPQLKQTIESSL